MNFFTYDISSISPVKLCVIPAVILLLSLLSVGMMWMQTGLPVSPGIEFEGGISVTIVTDESPEDITAYFSGYPLVSVNEGINNGKYLKFGPMDDSTVIEFTKKVEERYKGAKIDQIGSSFGKTLQDQATIAILISFIGMAIVVFVVFRTFVPAAAVVVSAFADMVMTAAAMNLFGIQLSLGTTAALLMLIGYSVDSDILLTSRVLKRKGRFDEKMQGAFKTGIIMTSTTFGAILAMWLVASIGGIQIIAEIGAVLLIGLLFDVMNTWLTNAGIIKWYMTEGKGRLSTAQRGA
ncbi:protein translocase subunit SecF [Methanospirillum stamsii]|uniref:Protein-export membrane protein SecF n=1 Tax=Methanospirillum stamsii TaxID=1277351 RepID=A0A2V2N345_9EURY|nr:protein translocase subunit SecF [Methanospirillum stamsii]PWR72935.1 preprotein translocase subunit SecF [Methanospirillum stamsii]